MTNLPGIAGKIEEVIGLEATVLLLRRRGGTEITIPVRTRGSWLAEVVGHDNARRMLATFGRGKLVLPCAEMRGQRARRAEAKQMLRDGKSIQQVALACDIHSRTVSNYRAEMERENEKRQLKLPF